MNRSVMPDQKFDLAVGSIGHCINGAGIRFPKPDHQLIGQADYGQAQTVNKALVYTEFVRTVGG